MATIFTILLLPIATKAMGAAIVVAFAMAAAAAAAAP